MHSPEKTKVSTYLSIRVHNPLDFSSLKQQRYNKYTRQLTWLKFNKGFLLSCWLYSVQRPLDHLGSSLTGSYQDSSPIEDKPNRSKPNPHILADKTFFRDHPSLKNSSPSTQHLNNKANYSKRVQTVPAIAVSTNTNHRHWDALKKKHMPTAEREAPLLAAHGATCI